MRSTDIRNPRQPRWNSGIHNPTMAPTQAAVLLQERLHELLSRVSSTMELIKSWPEATDVSRHVATTTKLIDAIRVILQALAKVEGTVQENEELRKALNECPVPMDLLELLDHGGGLNPECFTRGLMQEALGQLAGLKRRKRALQLLGAAVKSGMEAETQSTQEEEVKQETTKANGKEGEATEAVDKTNVPAEEASGVKRDSDQMEGLKSETASVKNDPDSEKAEPPAKKLKTEATTG